MKSLSKTPLIFLSVLFFKDILSSLMNQLLLKLDSLIHFSQFPWNNKELYLILIFVVFYVTFWSHLLPIKTKRISAPLALILLLFELLYFYESRYNNTKISFELIEFSFFRQTKLFDLVAIIPLPHILFSIYQELRSFYKKKQEQRISSLENEKPISKISDDSFYRKSLILRTIEEIKCLKNEEDSFIIGIEGTWGSGKSSFLQCLKSELNNPEYLLFDFNPWQFPKEKDLNVYFLRELRERIKNYISIHNLNGYLKSIDGTISILGIGISGLKRSLSINEWHENLKKDIKSSGKKVIVFIDDLDRLEKNEILEVLKILRNVGNLPNTIFILAYDREYIEKLLSDMSTSCDSYFSKFVQLEIPLGLIPKDNLIADIEETLVNRFSLDLTNTETTINSSVCSNLIYPKSYTLIRSKRDAIKLVNYINVQYPLIEKEVLFSDFLQLSIIKLRYPEIYRLFYNKSVVYQSHDRYIFNGEVKNVIALITSSEYERSILFEFLTQFFSGQSTSSLSITRVSRYDVYFKNEVYGNLVVSKILKLREEENGVEIYELVKDLIVDPQKKNLIIDYITNINSFSSYTDFEQIFVLYFSIPDLVSYQKIIWRQLNEFLYVFKNEQDKVETNLFDSFLKFDVSHNIDITEFLDSVHQSNDNLKIKVNELSWYRTNNYLQFGNDFYRVVKMLNQLSRFDTERQHKDELLSKVKLFIRNNYSSTLRYLINVSPQEALHFYNSIDIIFGNFKNFIQEFDSIQNMDDHNNELLKEIKAKFAKSIEKPSLTGLNLGNLMANNKK